jgi:phosphate starvation-inducible protein PhoH and related proteins
MKKKREEALVFTEEEVLTRKKNLVRSIVSRDVKIVAKNESQKELIRSIKNNLITICSGKAGTGKTFISLAYALNLLRGTDNKYQRIYLVKSVTTLKGEELGYLKGDLKEKITPFMMSFYINMEKFVDESVIDNLIDTNILKPFPLAFVRGVSLDNCIVILDEMQNVSIDNARTMLTRMGENSKLIILGDSNQIDLKVKSDSSLNVLLKMFEDEKKIGTIKMNDKDVNIRNPIIDLIEKRFEEYFK